MELMRQSYTITRDYGTMLAKSGDGSTRKAIRYDYGGAAGFAYRGIKNYGVGRSPVDVFFCDDGTTIITFTDIIAFCRNYGDENAVAHALRQSERSVAENVPEGRMQALREKRDHDFADAFVKAYHACHGLARERMDRDCIAKKGESWMRYVNLLDAA